MTSPYFAVAENVSLPTTFHLFRHSPRTAAEKERSLCGEILLPERQETPHSHDLWARICSRCWHVRVREDYPVLQGRLVALRRHWESEGEGEERVVVFIGPDNFFLLPWEVCKRILGKLPHKWATRELIITEEEYRHLLVACVIYYLCSEEERRQLLAACAIYALCGE